jgi:hypothetical protein
MIKIEIDNLPVRELKGTSMKSGSPKPYHMRFQTGYAFCVDSSTGAIAKYPDKFEIRLENEQSPFAPGVYQLLPSSLTVSRDGGLEVTPRLAPVAPAART